uniref:Mesoderm posterior bb n=1 Tax=Neolamprologus brichardi TaxID=32507 RepID=A0A3Q4GIA2_NEOBR
AWPGLIKHWSRWFSDSDLSSISSPETLSPVHSMDSSLSPSYQQLPQCTPMGAKTGYSQSLKSSPCSLSGRGRRTGRPTRIRSKQRESASEKEKLRMRDLTKALHHLRSYLPPSVAPAGQTLTKIETLRLTIRYISYLSSQLGLSEEVLFQRRERADASVSDTSSTDILSYFQSASTGGQVTQMQSQNLIQSSLHIIQNSLFVQQLFCMFLILIYLPLSSKQMCGKDFCTPLVPREYWG